MLPRREPERKYKPQKRRGKNLPARKPSLGVDKGTTEERQGDTVVDVFVSRQSHRCIQT
jgi:hypothetical protein